MLRAKEKAHAVGRRLSSVGRAPRVARMDTYGDNTGSTAMTTLTANGSAHTKGNWSEIISATAFDINGFWVSAGVGSTVRARFLFDIGIGAGGAETVLVPNILWSMLAVSGFGWGPVYMPIHIPGGTRIAGRCQSSTGGASMTTQLYCVRSDENAAGSCRRATNYGANTGNTWSDCDVDPNDTAHTKGVYDVVTSSTTNPIKALVICASTLSNDFGSSRNGMFDLATGGAGSEVVLVPNLWYAQNNTSDNMTPSAWGPFWLPIPAGTRLAGRAQSSASGDGTGAFGFTVIGFD